MEYPSLFPVIESRRLRLRNLEKKDVDNIFEIYNDPRVAEYDDFEPITEKEEAITIIKNYNNQFESKSQIRWGIELLEEHKIVGTCGLSNFDENNNKCIIGYDLVYSNWNNGIMTEAIALITEYAYENIGIHRIEAFITPGNNASIKVLLKNGYQEEGLLREMEYFKGKYQDGVVVAIIESDYKIIKTVLDKKDII